MHPLALRVPSHLIHFATGNGLETTHTYYPGNARLHTVQTKAGSLNPIQDMEYGWDELGNLNYRKKWIDRNNDIYLNESFKYDVLNRLDTIHLNEMETGLHEYDEDGLGNMVMKKANNNVVFANGAYEGSRPHALTSAHVNNNLRAYTSDDQAIGWTSFDQPEYIDQGSNRLEFTYGHHHQRIRQLYRNENGETIKTFTDNCEFVSIDGQQYAYTYLSGPTGLFGIHVQQPDRTSVLFYIHTDHLGSLHTITDESGNLLQELSFDAWGNRRNPATWTFFEENTETTLFDRGFTGHEHLDGFQLINMNGRLYDPVVSRMLSPDNFVQSPDFSQSFNRYSYAWNNPLVYTDPSGEFIWAVVGMIAIGGYEMLKPSGWDGWEKSGKNTVDAGLNGLIFGGPISVTPISILKYAGKTVANRFIADNVDLSGSSGNWSYSITPGFGLGAEGYFSYNFFGTLGFGDGKTNFGFGIGRASNIWSYGGHIRKHNGFGIGYYYTNYGDETGPDGKSNKQIVPGFQFYWRGGSLRWENDIFAFQGFDRWRSNALELSIGKYVFGFSVYNNDPESQGLGYENKPSRSWGLNQSDEYDAWKNGKTYMAPFWFGFKSGNNISRFGYSHWLVQDLSQNFTHQQPYFKGANQHYYLDYDDLYTGRWGYQGFYNPFSLYNH